MKLFKLMGAFAVLAAVSGCASNPNTPAAAVAPSGIAATGSAGMTGGAAAAPPGVGTVARTRVQ